MKKITIIGGGPGGYVAAIRAAQLGAEVTLIEREHLGGTCLNIGCIPTKSLLHTAELAEEIRTGGAELGIDVADFKINFPKVMEHKRAISAKLVNGVTGLMRANKIKVIEGEARFVSPGRIVVETTDGKTIEPESNAIIIAVGSINTVPPIPGAKDNPCCIDSTGALSLEELPESMVVIGAGVIGLELACAYQALGTKVTVIEARDIMLPMLDADITSIGVGHMKKMGIQIFTECSVEAVEKCPYVAVLFKSKSGEVSRIEADKVLIATGRKANTASLDLSAGGISNERGSIVVNDHMETNVSGVYAIGDCVYGKAQLAHTASAMGEVAAENIMGMDSVYDEKTNPTCVYILPEAARVGLTEQECIDNNIPYIVGKFPLAANGKALITNGGEGLVKIIAGSEYGEILGVHMIGPRATDLISEGALAIGDEMTLDELIETIHSHPTVSEAVREAALNAEKRSIHIINR